MAGRRQRGQTRHSEHGPRVSVGLPVYNGENYLEEALRSILRQTMDDFELVISDNASTDATAEICRSYASDERVRYYRNHTNLGGAPNFNRVFALSRAPYFKWHGHDDVIGERYLEACVELLDCDPSVVCAYPKIVHVDAAGEAVARQRAADLSIRSPAVAARVGRLITYETTDKDIFWCAVFGLLRRSALERTSLLGSYNAADQVLVFQLVLQGGFAQADEFLYFRREHPQASMKAHKTKQDVLRWFDPTVEKRIILTQSRIFAEHVAAVRRAKPGLAEEARAYGHVARRFLWKEWRNIPGELKEAMLTLAGK